jgi:hypothetical protein
MSKQVSVSEEVVVGKLVNPQQIDVSGRLVGFKDFQHRAMWSYLRLQYGRQIDALIRSLFKDKKVRNKAQAHTVLEKFFWEKVKQADLERVREIQFILRGDDTVMAVASLKHLLIPQSSVYATANTILSDSGQQRLLIEEDVAGQVVYEREAAGIQYGLQIYAGSINTRFAIRVAVMFKVMQCLNVVSWLGIGSFRQWIPNANKNYERVLRIKDVTELEPRLKQAMAVAQNGLSRLDAQIQASKKIKLTKKAARALAASMGFSYGLGGSTVKQVLDRYAEEEQTLYGLAMAESWVGKRGDFSPVAREVSQKLSTMAGASILIKDPKDAEKKSIAWLKSHIKKGELKSIDDIVGDLI